MHNKWLFIPLHGRIQLRHRLFSCLLETSVVHVLSQVYCMCGCVHWPTTDTASLVFAAVTADVAAFIPQNGRGNRLGSSSRTEL